MNLFENLQTLKEFDKPVKVSNKNYKRTLKEISDVILSVSQKELIPKQCNEIIEDIYYKIIELKDMFINEDENKSSEELKDAIHLAYMNTPFENYIEDFVSARGVSPDSETIFDGLSDEVIKELYDDLKNKLIKQYGPDYDNLNNGVYNAFNLAFKTESVKTEAPKEFFSKMTKAKETLSQFSKDKVDFVKSAYEEVLADIGDAFVSERGDNSSKIKNEWKSLAAENGTLTEEEFDTIYSALEVIGVFYSHANA